MGDAGSRRGQLLIVVGGVIGVVTMAMGAVTSWTIHELRLGAMPMAQVQHEAVVQTAVSHAIALLREDSADLDHLDEPWATGEQDGEPVFNEVAVGSGTFSVGTRDDGGEFVAGLLDEERKLPLNAATPEALQALISAVDPSGSVEAAAVAAAIVDWRDEAPGSWCPDPPTESPCHNGPFDTVEELQLVPGVTAELYDALAPRVTVYGLGVVNVNTASAEVLDAVGCPGASLIAEREASGPFDASPCPAAGVASTAFTVPIEAEVAGVSGRAAWRAVVDRTACAGGAPEAPCILAWTRR